MTMNFARQGFAFTLAVAVVMALSLSSLVHPHGSAVELIVVPDATQPPKPSEQAADRSDMCEREAEKLLGQKAFRIGGSMRAPKKLRNVPPKYPALPPGTLASGVWVGEILINNSGKIARVWTLREVRFVPPFPAFNNAITDAIQQWQFESLLVQGKATPVCMTVTINIDWQ